MWKFKSCPKCKGDLYAEEDMNGWDEKCLQCGYTRSYQISLDVKGSKNSMGSLMRLPELEKVPSASRR